jgi:hypothetical protein
MAKDCHQSRHYLIAKCHLLLIISHFVRKSRIQTQNMHQRKLRDRSNIQSSRHEREDYTPSKSILLEACLQTFDVATHTPNPCSRRSSFEIQALLSIFHCSMNSFNLFRLQAHVSRFAIADSSCEPNPLRHDSSNKVASEPFILLGLPIPRRKVSAFFHFLLQISARKLGRSAAR